MTDEAARRSHWETVYTSKAETDLSWFEGFPAVSLDLIHFCEANREAAIIDVGGGSSHLVDALLGDGFHKITVLDISKAALEASQRRLGDRAAEVRWVAADATGWMPDAAAYDVWHDRAAFHFLTDARDKEAYLRNLKRALKVGGHTVIGTFALDGPERCSGLPVCRYSPDILASTLGPDFKLLTSRSHLHTTPWGATQTFQFSVFRHVD